MGNAVPNRKGLLIVVVLVAAMATSMWALSLSTSPSNEEERAIQIARDFIMNAPTFSFDGIPDTLNVENVDVLESWPLQYVITITFDSRHAGYGDRTGQILLQVITPHSAKVRVVEGEVVSAVLDDQWDEVNQEPLHVL